MPLIDGTLTFSLSDLTAVKLSFVAALMLARKAMILPIANPNDPALFRDANGKVVEQKEVAPDWPLSGEKHERRIVWQGTDQELEES